MEFSHIVEAMLSESVTDVRNTVWYQGRRSAKKVYSYGDLREEGHKQEGPGFYFTNSRDDAMTYGPNLHTVRISPKKVVPARGVVDPMAIEKLIKSTGGRGRVRLKDWDDDPKTALRMAIESYTKYTDGPQEAFQSVWGDFFSDDVQYLKTMVSLGYGGHIPSWPRGVIHFVAYDPKIIKVQNVERI